MSSLTTTATATAWYLYRNKPVLQVSYHRRQSTEIYALILRLQKTFEAYSKIYEVSPKIPEHVR